ncbi:MAG: aminotransferase class V-fold PLP-dependent enzyme [Treponema sp.]|nr:aminotransferase class V-fold PLP-dependent enzyme [Treponema sp.]
MENKNKEKRTYFDWAASAPYYESNTLVPYGNPSSQHYEGKMAKAALEDARLRCAAVLNVPPATLYFTSGGTESNSIALFSNLRRPGMGRIISSLTEHASIREGMETLEKMGKPVGTINVDSTGRVTTDTLLKTLNQYDDVRFAAIMSVNNETGAVTDIPSIKDVLCGQKGAPIHFHCDLVQSIGKIPVNLINWEIDSASISAHKVSGPCGIGLLYLRKPLEVFYTGGGQENKIRGGTENTHGAVALANCLEKSCCNEQVIKSKKQAAVRWNKLITSLTAIDRCTIIPKERIANDDIFSPYILQAAFKDIPGEVMARALDDLGIAVSTGSACSSSSPERPVLTAIGIEEKLRIEGIRISQGHSTTDEDIDHLLFGISEVLKFL